ncbi:MAG: hypothetical protein ACYTF1_06055 [Planctomycetota bacterium]|jgi:hypothetical protein
MPQDEQVTTTRGAILKFAYTVLTHRHMPIFVALLAIILTLPSLNVEWIFDDYYHRGILTGPPRVAEFFTSPMDIFCFFDGDLERTGKLTDLGLCPWWTYQGAKVAFWRPLTVLTHWLDYRLWPRNPALMHMQSILWYGLLVTAVAFLYRRFMGLTLVAGLAALLYAIDDAHGMPVAFIANRSAIVATLFGVLVLVTHDRWRRDGWSMGAVLGPLFMAVSLFSAEIGISTCAYLFAYALFIDRGTRRQRYMVLIAYALVVIVWRITWTYMGYGVYGVGFYVDPLTEPLRFITSALYRIPILLLGQWAEPASDITLLLGPKGMTILVMAALAFLIILALVLWPIIRRDRLARFWTLGMLLSVIPICTTFPANRMLFFVGIGGMGLLAQFFVVVFDRSHKKPSNRFRRSAAIYLGYMLVVINLILAPIRLPLHAALPVGRKKFINQLFVNTPMDSSVEQQDVVIVNAPLLIAAMYKMIIRELDGQPIPRHARILTPALPSSKIYRPDAQSLIIRPENSFLSWKFDRLFRNRYHPMYVGERVKLTGMTVEVLAITDDGRPAEAAFYFDVPLEDVSLLWLQWKDGEFIPFVPPKIGETVKLRPDCHYILRWLNSK